MSDNDSPQAKRKAAREKRIARAKAAYERMSPEDKRLVNIGTNFSVGGTYQERQARHTEYRAKKPGAYTTKKGGTIKYSREEE